MPLIGKENFKKLTDKGYDSANKDLRGVFFAGLSSVVQGTPVDTGRARNNWFLSVGIPSSSTTTSKAKGLGAIRQLRGMPQRVLNKKIYFTNNLPYAGTLEFGGFPANPRNGTGRSSGGFSTQAPNGWVRATLKRMQIKIKAL